ncbi:hypothetical protein [Leptospira sp. GIMC2001]|uniref:hypothetical protein n=1 Tax=Leptospira sp. GIMC2001 TaxID=1513297 RepID=UPI0023496D84|nr:hypothetical protein [Leptospira sp. GIMC2001]WCL47926.1 hypothetical protein O4O04_11390 [Leptospira sp. GIMC2001]
MKPDPIRKTSVSQTISVIRSAPHEKGVSSSQVSAMVQNSIKAGNIAQFKTSGKIWEAKVAFNVFAKEVILLDAADHKGLQWKVRQRIFQDHLQNKSSSLTDNNPSKTFRSEKVSLVLEKLAQPENFIKDGFIDDKIFKTLDQMFSLISWNPETQFFSWKWEDSEAEGYFSNDDSKKGFLIQYNSNNLGKAWFYFFFDEKENWDLKAMIENIEFYELFLADYDSLRQLFVDAGIRPNSVSIEYGSENSIESNKGWIA